MPSYPLRDAPPLCALFIRAPSSPPPVRIEQCRRVWCRDRWCGDHAAALEAINNRARHRSGAEDCRVGREMVSHRAHAGSGEHDSLLFEHLLDPIRHRLLAPAVDSVGELVEPLEQEGGASDVGRIA